MPTLTGDSFNIVNTAVANINVFMSPITRRLRTTGCYSFITIVMNSRICNSNIPKTAAATPFSLNTYPFIAISAHIYIVDTNVFGFFRVKVCEETDTSESSIHSGTSTGENQTLHNKSRSIFCV